MRGDPKYLVRLDMLINSSKSSKQSLGMEVRAWSLLKSMAGKGISWSENAESVVQPLKRLM